MWDKAEKFLASDKYISPLIKKYGSCKIKPNKKESYFLDLVESIMFQQLSGKAAETILQRFKKGLGGKITPEKTLKIKDEEFRSWGVSRQKLSYLRDLSEHVIQNKLEIKKLDKLSDEKVIEELVAVKGIGVWTAQMFLMFTLGRPDIFPVADLGIKRGFKILVEKDLNDEDMVKFSNRWKPYRTLASWYIWKAADN